MKINNKYQFKYYKASESCIFRKTKDLFGGLSNMASGFSVNVNGINILTSEALYQACRFPHLPEVQEKIFKERSPMTAKMVSKHFRNDSRIDWDDNRIKIMRWCLRVKLAQNFIEFGKLLESTGDKPIIEDSSKDDFWGAIRDKEDKNFLVGVNALGRLLMELRQFYNENRYSYDMFVVEPLDIPDFKLLKYDIKIIDERAKFISFIVKNVNFSDLDIKLNNPVQYIVSDNNINIINEPVIPELNLKSVSKKRIKKEDRYNGQGTLPF